MSEPLKPGDLAMVVRDTHNLQTMPCYGALIGMPVVVGSPFVGSCVPAWYLLSELRCPRCNGKLPFLFADELQKLRGPGVFGNTDGLVGVDENGNGWRLCNDEAGA